MTGVGAPPPLRKTAYPKPEKYISRSNIPRGFPAIHPGSMERNKCASNSIRRVLSFLMDRHVLYI
jgi:hypothetical protein